MTSNQRLRHGALLSAIWLTGIVTLLASSLEDDSISTPPVPVDVDFTLSSLADPLTREIDTRTVALDNLILTGRYSANQGDKLTLDRDSIDLDTDSRFDVTVVATDPDELLEGLAEIQITAALDVGIDHEPAAGQFSSLYDGTTTIVTANGSGVDVVVGASGTTESFGWDEFVARADDDDETLDVRMASAAYNMIDFALRTALLAEDLIDDVEDNKTVLEGMNLDEPLTLTCDNTATGGSGESVLFWTTDASGSGAGSIGAGDAFEARFENCRDLATDRYFDGTVLLDNYNPADDTGFDVYGIDVEVRDLFVAENEVDLVTVPAPESPRIDGELALFYVETATAR